MEKPQSKPQWVKLHLVPQTEGTNTMPPFVVGLLIGETQDGRFILNPMLDLQENPNTYEEELIPAGMNFINRTYVWRCQILDQKPETTEEEATGGLG